MCYTYLLLVEVDVFLLSTYLHRASLFSATYWCMWNLIFHSIHVAVYFLFKARLCVFSKDK